MGFFKLNAAATERIASSLLLLTFSHKNNNYVTHIRNMNTGEGVIYICHIYKKCD